MKPLINDYSFISLIKIDCMQKNFHIFVINYTIKKKGLPNITRGCWAQIGFDPQNFRISPTSWNGCWSLKWHLGNEASLCSQSVTAFQQCCHAAAYDLEENSSAPLAHERLKLHCSKGRIEGDEMKLHSLIFLKHARLDSSDFIGFIQDLVMIQKVNWLVLDLEDSIMEICRTSFSHLSERSFEVLCSENFSVESLRMQAQLPCPCRRTPTQRASSSFSDHASIMPSSFLELSDPIVMLLPKFLGNEATDEKVDIESLGG